MCVEFSGGRNSLENVPTYAKEINSGIFGNLTLGRKNEGLKSRDLNLQEGPGHANRAGCMTAPAFDRPQSACALLHGARLHSVAARTAWQSLPHGSACMSQPGYGRKWLLPPPQPVPTNTCAIIRGSACASASRWLPVAGGCDLKSMSGRAVGSQRELILDQPSPARTDSRRSGFYPQCSIRSPSSQHCCKGGVALITRPVDQSRTAPVMTRVSPSRETIAL